MDQGWVEIGGAQGIFRVRSKVFKRYQIWQSSSVTIHLSVIFLFIFILFLVCLDSLSVSVTLKMLR